jgi:hypothetical protein
MSNDATWLLLSFAIMVVAVLARLSDKVEKLEKRLVRIEPPEEGDEDTLYHDGPVSASSMRERGRRARR